jgi:hypothetical protein
MKLPKLVACRKCGQATHGISWCVSAHWARVCCWRCGRDTTVKGSTRTEAYRAWNRANATKRRRQA